MPTPKVFLDANVVIAAGKPPGGPILARVADLVEADLITVLTTDLTVTEVSKKHAENDYEVIKIHVGARARGVEAELRSAVDIRVRTRLTAHHAYRWFSSATAQHVELVLDSARGPRYEGRPELPSGYGK